LSRVFFRKHCECPGPLFGGGSGLDLLDVRNLHNTGERQAGRPGAWMITAENGPGINYD